MSMDIGVDRVLKSCSKIVRPENRNCKLNSTWKNTCDIPCKLQGGAQGRLWIWTEMKSTQSIQFNIRSIVELDKRAWNVGRKKFRPEWKLHQKPHQWYRCCYHGYLTWGLFFNSRCCAPFFMALFYMPHVNNDFGNSKTLISIVIGVAYL